LKKRTWSKFSGVKSKTAAETAEKAKSDKDKNFCMFKLKKGMERRKKVDAPLLGHILLSLSRGKSYL
jgi:hypothetical protein